MDPSCYSLIHPTGYYVLRGSHIVPSDSTLTLFIPDLFGFQSILSTLSKDELSQLPEFKLPVLEKWLSRGLIEESKHQNDIVFSEFGLSVEKDQDKHCAALSLLAESNVEINVTTDSYWLRADPVNLQPDLDTALLSAHEELALTQDEANKLVEQINKHFMDEPWEIYAFAPHRWYLRLEAPADLKTSPLAKVLGEDISQFMPMGNDANYWFKITNEIQMLLHGSNVNFERDSKNMWTANSIWLWGGGCLPDSNLNSGYDKIITNSILYSGIGFHCGFDVLPLDDGFAKNIKSGNNFIVLELLSEHVQRRDLYSFVQALNEIEETYFKICNELLLNNKIEKIKIISDSETTITVTKRSLRRWWKRTKSFSSFKYA